MVWWHKEPQDDSNFSEKPHLWLGESTHTVSSFQYSPAQILGFVVFPDKVLKAIVRTCQYGDKKSSVFSSSWQLAFLTENGTSIPYCMAIDIDTIIRPCLIVPKSESSDEVNQIWPRELWADEFFNC